MGQPASKTKIEPAAKLLAWVLGISAVVGVGFDVGLGIEKAISDRNAGIIGSVDEIANITPEAVENCFGKIRNFVFKRDTSADGDMPGVRCSIKRDKSGHLTGIEFSTGATAPGSRITARVMNFAGGKQEQSFVVKFRLGTATDPIERLDPSSDASSPRLRAQVRKAEETLATAASETPEYQRRSPQWRPD